MLRLCFSKKNYGKERGQNERLNNLLARLEIDRRFFDREVEEAEDAEENSTKSFQDIYLEMLEEQRRLLNKINHLSEFDEDLIRKYLSLIDIEEYKIREKKLPEAR